MLGQNFYPKIASNKWWDKYRGEDNVLIEDMDNTHSYQGYYLKIWADKYAFPVEVKNGADWIRPKIIIVTSNYPIEKVFPDPAIHLPLLERFKVIHKSVKWNATVNDLPLAVDDSDSDEGYVKTNSFKSKPIRKRARKFDKPAKKPALYRQDANGKIVINNEKQVPIVQSLALREAQEIAKEKEVIELMDDSVNSPADGDYLEALGIESCEYCNKKIYECKCFESSDVDIWDESGSMEEEVSKDLLDSDDEY